MTVRPANTGTAPPQAHLGGSPLTLARVRRYRRHRSRGPHLPEHLRAGEPVHQRKPGLHPAHGAMAARVGFHNLVVAFDLRFHDWAAGGSCCPFILVDLPAQDPPPPDSRRRKVTDRGHGDVVAVPAVAGSLSAQPTTPRLEALPLGLALAIGLSPRSAEPRDCSLPTGYGSPLEA